MPSNWQVWQNSEIANSFVDDRRRGIPGATEQFQVLLQLLSECPPSENRTLLEMGCGDGILTQTTLGLWQNAKCVLLDGSATMLERAKERLSDAKQEIHYVESDFNNADWSEKLPDFPNSQFDAIISGFAIHHSEDERKRELYAEIFPLLKPGGVFVNIEHVASANPIGEAFFERTYALQITKNRHAKGETSFGDEKGTSPLLDS